MPGEHRVLDIPTVSMGQILRNVTPDDDFLGEMLKVDHDPRPGHSFLVAAEVTEHAERVAARNTLGR